MKPQIPGTCFMPVSCPQQTSGFIPGYIPGFMPGMKPQFSYLVTYPVSYPRHTSGGFIPVSSRLHTPSIPLVSYLVTYPVSYRRFHTQFHNCGFIPVSCWFHSLFHTCGFIFVVSYLAVRYRVPYLRFQAGFIPRTIRSFIPVVS